MSRTYGITLEGVKDSLEGLGATPTGAAHATPAETRPTKEPLLERKRPSKGSGDTARVSIRGTPTDFRNESTHT